MRASAIRRGDLLSLKPTRQAAYGISNRVVRVVGFTQREGYKVPYVLVAYDGGKIGHFEPSDFAKVVEVARLPG